MCLKVDRELTQQYIDSDEACVTRWKVVTQYEGSYYSAVFGPYEWKVGCNEANGPNTLNGRIADMVLLASNITPQEYYSKIPVMHGNVYSGIHVYKDKQLAQLQVSEHSRINFKYVIMEVICHKEDFIAAGYQERSGGETEAYTRVYVGKLPEDNQNVS